MLAVKFTSTMLGKASYSPGDEKEEEGILGGSLEKDSELSLVSFDPRQHT